MSLERWGVDLTQSVMRKRGSKDTSYLEALNPRSVESHSHPRSTPYEGGHQRSRDRRATVGPTWVAMRTQMCESGRKSDNDMQPPPYPPPGPTSALPRPKRLTPNREAATDSKFRNGPHIARNHPAPTGHRRLTAVVEPPIATPDTDRRGLEFMMMRSCVDEIA